MARQSLLWSIVPPEGQSSWLFGTMHIRDDRAYQLCRELYPLINKSDRFIAEMDLDMRPPELNLPPYDIRQFLRAKQYQKLKHQLQKSFHLDLDHFAHLHPMMIMSILSTSVLQSEHLISLDEHLWQYAKEQQKEVSGLESYEDQLNILHSIEVGPLYKQLFDVSRRPSSIKKSTLKGLELYISGHIHPLYKLSKTSMQHLRKKVIYERNKNMVSVINHLNMSMQYFITVGAGHLSGKFGLLSLLRKSGWKLKPVRIFSIPSEE